MKPTYEELEARVVELEKSLGEARKQWDEFLEAEHKLSDAYLRIRKILNAFQTPYAPTPEQIYQHTEAKLAALEKSNKVMRECLELNKSIIDEWFKGVKVEPLSWEQMALNRMNNDIDEALQTPGEDEALEKAKRLVENNNKEEM